MIEGTLRNVPLADVFQIVVSGRKTGVLEVVRGDRNARIHFEVGKLRYASLRPGVHLGEILMRMDLLTAREVQELLAEQAHENAGAPLGHTAVRRGLLDDADLAAALQRQITEVVGELITWRDGAFSFTESPLVRTYVPSGHDVDAMLVLLEVAGMWQDVRADAVDGATVFARRGDPTSVALPDGAWEVLSQVDGRRSVRAVAAEADIPARRTYAILAELEELGVLARVPFPHEEPLVLVVSPSHALQRLLSLAAERVGVRTTVVGSGADAVATARGERPKAIVVDEDDGSWPTVRGLRDVDGLAHVPLLVLSERPATRWTRWRRPRADEMAKPFDELELQQWLGRRLGRPVA